MPLAYTDLVQKLAYGTDTISVGSVGKNYPGGFEAFKCI
jgi:hypothetical protein